MDRVLCLNIFPKEFHELLSTFKYSDIPLKNKSFDKPILYLLDRCANVFFHKPETVEERIKIEEKVTECLNIVCRLLHITWEKLNTGVWKEVDIAWRYMYSFSSLFKVLCLLSNDKYDEKEIFHVCDMGLLMGAPILDNILSKIATLLTKVDDVHETEPMKKKKKSTNSDMGQQGILQYPLAERKWISCEEFSNSYVKTQCPVILLNAIKHWPAFSERKWSIEYILQKAKHRTVPIEIGQKYTDEDWTQKLMTIGDFVSQHVLQNDETQKVGYLAQHSLFDQIPELKEDIRVPYYIKSIWNNEAEVDINAWFGPTGTISPLHYDPKHNFLVQIMGEKYIRLYAKETTVNLYPREDTILKNTSHVDVENPDPEQYPLFCKAPYRECILKPGNMLYIPPECWHYVRSLSISFSVSFWWK